MTQSGVIEILKKALLLEKRGEAFYKKVAEQVNNKELKEFFMFMAKEEELHVKILANQFKSYNKNKILDLGSIDLAENGGFDSVVLSEETKSAISAAGFESAAISAAISMEKSAVELYSSRTVEAEDEDEKKLYKWLADWEQTHLDELMALDKELCEQVWFDNQFWPF